MSRKTICIAEIGENHIGNIDLAARMIKDAASAGADFVKFQSYSAKDVSANDPEKEWFSKVELTNKAHYELKAIAEQNNVSFLSSPFSLERARFLCEELKLKAVKVASGMMLNFNVLDYLNSFPVDTVFLSTGLSTVDEIRMALAHLRKIPRIYLLHCVVQYPCRDEDANLMAIATLQKEFDAPVGYSDHTIGIEACIAAAVLGVRVIEKHFTHNKDCPEGTDHVVSATKDEFAEMVKRIHKVETLLGSGIKKPTREERRILEFVRRRFSGDKKLHAQ